MPDASVCGDVADASNLQARLDEWGTIRLVIGASRLCSFLSEERPWRLARVVRPCAIPRLPSENSQDLFQNFKAWRRSFGEYHRFTKPMKNADRIYKQLIPCTRCFTDIIDEFADKWESYSETTRQKIIEGQAAPAGASAEKTPADLLKELKSLLDAGLLPQALYDKKVEEVVAKMCQ